MMEMLHENLGTIGQGVVLVIDAIAVLVIIRGFCKTIMMYMRAERELLNTKKSFNDFHHIRQELASYLLLSLEFVVAADIIHTISSPTMHNILLLGLIVVIRTSISFVLERELKQKKSK